MLAALGLGSNVGDKLTNINDAVLLLEQSEGINILKRSSNYRTEPWGILEQDWFVNICLLIDTELEAGDLLNRCLEIEQELGRIREEKWGPRKIDIDILIFGGNSVELDGLTIPHPRIEDRAFVLVPLAEVWPEANINGQTAVHAMNLRNDLDEVQLLGTNASI